MFENIGKMANQMGGAEALKGYLAQLPFPIDKNQLVQMATSKGLPEPVMNLLNKLPDNRMFKSSDEVVEEAKQVH